VEPESPVQHRKDTCVKYDQTQVWFRIGAQRSGPNRGARHLLATSLELESNTLRFAEVGDWHQARRSLESAQCVETFACCSTSSRRLPKKRFRPLRCSMFER